MSEATTSTTALAAPTKTAARIVDDPAALTDEQLLELFERNDRRALVIGGVSGAAAAAATAVLTSVTPIGAWAMIPAFLVGFFGAVRVARRAAAAQDGVTERCQARVVAAFQKELFLREVRWRDLIDVKRDRNRRVLAWVRARLDRDALLEDLEIVKEVATPNTEGR